MSADGGRPVAVLTDDGDDRSAQWSNDGRGLYYLHNFDTPRPEVRFIASRTLYYLALDSAAHASVWSIDRQGGIPTPLVSFDDPSREWHRYGFGVFRGRFYFTLGDRQSDLWVAEVDPGN